MTPGSKNPVLRIAVPKGRMQEGVTSLLAEAGLHLPPSPRSYRPRICLPGCEVKILKPQNIVEMLHAGSRDLGFTGADWLAELDGEAVELLDTGLDPVRLVAATATALLDEGRLPQRPLVVASEYERLTRAWIRRRGLDARFVRSYGATEVFPPEDADVIVDITATGATLAENGLVVLEEISRSSTRLYASRGALADGAKKGLIEDLALLLGSVLEARRRVMVEVNVGGDRLDELLAILPCMRQPTVAPLARGEGYAVKVAVRRDELPRVIPRIKAAGGSDLVVTQPAQIVP